MVQTNRHKPVSIGFRGDTFVQSTLRPIQFVGDLESKEVQAILEQNSQERTRLFEIYSSDRFLETTLRKLTEPDY